MNRRKKIDVNTAKLIAGSILIGAAILGTIYYSHKPKTDRKDFLVCLQVQELEYYSPAWEIETGGLNTMVHQSLESLHCVGVINNRVLDIPATQIWVKRQ